MKPTLSLLLLLLLLLSCSSGKTGGRDESDSDYYTNPLLPQGGSDASAVYYNGKYYYTHETAGNIMLWEAEDITDLFHAKCKEVWLPKDSTNNQHLWDPEICRIDGKWYILDGTHDDSMIWHSTTCKHDYFLKSDNDEIIKTTRVEGVMVDGSKGGYGVFPPANESMDISLTEYNK